MHINGNIAKFTMSLKGGKLPDDFSATINVTMDFTGASTAQLIECCAGGSSARVKLQSKLRALKPAQLRAYELEGYKTTFVQVMSSSTVVVDYKSALLALTHDEFITRVTTDIGCNEDQADKYYNKLHNS